MQVTPHQLSDRAVSSHREWLETDGLGGYASMTVGGSRSRRYHGLLCVPLFEFGERHVLISKLMPTVTLDDGQRFELDCNFFSGSSNIVSAPQGDHALERFWIDQAPRWEFRCGKALLQITILMPRGSAVTLIEYRLTGAARATLDLQPLVAARNIHRTTHENSSMNTFPTWNESTTTLTIEPYTGYPGFQILAPGRTRWTSASQWWRNFYLAREAERGFDAREDLYSPGYFTLALLEGASRVVALCAPAVRIDCSLDDLFANEITRRRDRYGTGGVITSLRRAAEQFLVTDSRSNAGIIAGYPWFERWGRDTLISVSGLTQVLGDTKTERAIIEFQISLVQDGLVPNLITEDGTRLYNSIDAVLWLFVATYRHFRRTEDQAWVANVALPVLRAVVAALQVGTRFGIFVSGDGLLSAGSGDVQLTWMDAKIDGKPVTPRHGKAVEINALWFNAITILAELETSSTAALTARAFAALIQRSFVAAFTKPDGTLRDVIDARGALDTEDDTRPNQIFACCLPFPVLDSSLSRPILTRMREQLVTKRGLRTLTPNNPIYRPRYEGSPQARDNAYHQGTVWPWLFGPYGEALARAGEGDELAQLQNALTVMLGEGCIGSIAEVYDADDPQRPEGCFAQAWSVAAASTIISR